MSSLRDVAGQFGALVTAALRVPGEWAARLAAAADQAAGTIMLASGCTAEEAMADLNAARRQMISRNWDDAVDWVLTEKREKLRADWLRSQYRAGYPDGH
jgi:hypothetical protein